ncbi:stAR-related lipid transfer protein 5-like [Saccoglossus kowalevskii]|uniref:StAR-related lipid transfer protein 6-like n=1 Tax=Saccoglossus kowalevskii TaxID=10224 RepID=A0ABM0GRW3_SACKO|nr:PREDICTED: stAR-related lipid transfer protein 6-like [Saccoglossus kowalevskii]
MADYSAIAEETLTKVNAYVESTDWKPWKTSKGMEIVYKPSSDFKGNVYKTMYELDAPREKILELIWDLKQHEKWETALKGGMECVEQIRENLMVIRSVSAPLLKGLVSARDFIDLLGYKYYPEKNLILIYWTGVEHPKYKDTVKGCVRANTYPSAIYLYPAEGDGKKTRGVNIFQLEGHLVPKTLTERFIPDLQFDWYHDIKKVL